MNKVKVCVCDYSVNKCNGMLFTLLLRMGLCNSINKLSFRHSKKSFRAPPITRKLSRELYNCCS